jgi:hypothetical protein
MNSTVVARGEGEAPAESRARNLWSHFIIAKYVGQGSTSSHGENGLIIAARREPRPPIIANVLCNTDLSPHNVIANKKIE